MTAPLHRQESGRYPSFQGIFHPFYPLQDSVPKGRRVNAKVTRTELELSSDSATEFELTTDSEAELELSTDSETEQEFELFTDSEAGLELSTDSEERAAEHGP